METIIVADDDAIFQEILRRHLTQMDFNVVTTPDGSKVLSLIETHKPIACFIDIMMDKKEGLETISEIIEQPNRPYIIAVSSNLLYLEFALKLGADTSIIKPINPGALALALSKIHTSRHNNKLKTNDYNP